MKPPGLAPGAQFTVINTTDDYEVRLTCQPPQLHWQ